MIELLVQIKLTVLAVYLALGALFAVAFHAAGLQRVDAGTKGAGVLFRVLITPGVVALWPLLATRWRRAGRGEGGPGPVHPPVSARGLRAFHRRLAIGLAVLVPAVAAVGIALRPARPLPARGGPVVAEPAPLPQVLAEYDDPFAGLPVRLRLRAGDAGGRQLELEVGEDLQLPALHLYWVPAGADFPEGATRLGPVWGPGTRRFAVEREPAGGTLVLYSAVLRERVGAFTPAGV